jgi:hypothetical protein
MYFPSTSEMRLGHVTSFANETLVEVTHQSTGFKSQCTVHCILCPSQSPSHTPFMVIKESSVEMHIPSALTLSDYVEERSLGNLCYRCKDNPYGEVWG